MLNNIDFINCRALRMKANCNCIMDRHASKEFAVTDSAMLDLMSIHAGVQKAYRVLVVNNVGFLVFFIYV